MPTTTSTTISRSRQADGTVVRNRRAKGKSTISTTIPDSTTTKAAAGTPSTPLHTRTTLTVMKTNSVSTKAESSFLPELNSTPPMPTFQKPLQPHLSASGSPLGGKENAPPSTPPSTPATAGPRPDSGILPSLTSDPGNFPNTPKPLKMKSSNTSTTLPTPRPPNETPPLPEGWTQQHDRAICVLDVRNYTLQATVAKIRRAFPGLKGVLTPGMVDRRLRQLDQDVEVDYWRVGLGLQQNGKGGRVREKERVDSGVVAEVNGVQAVKQSAPTVSLVTAPSRDDLIRDAVPVTAAQPEQKNNITHKFSTGFRTVQAV